MTIAVSEQSLAGMPARGGTFDFVARAYLWMEYVAFGRSLERCRERFLGMLGEQGSALVLGDGDGRFVSSLLAANPAMEVDAVDESGAMLRLLQARVRRVGAEDRLRMHCEDALGFEFWEGRRYDLVATHFFLDCLRQAEVEALCGRVVARLENGALWVVSEFRIPEGAMRWPARALVRGLYFGFRMLAGLRTTELPDYTQALRAAGFVKIAQRLSLAGVLTAEVWQLAVPGE
jgi:SAM-dependent methyltransferase